VKKEKVDKGFGTPNRILRLAQVKGTISGGIPHLDEYKIKEVKPNSPCASADCDREHTTALVT
jgi:hypothetical protein